MKQYTVVYFGTWGYGYAGFKGLASSKNVRIKQVFTKWLPDAPNAFRDKVKIAAQEQQLPIFNSEKTLCSKHQWRDAITKLQPFDILLSCCYDWIFPKAILELPTIAAINVHPSLLPKFRGIKPLEQAIAQGNTETGVSMHLLTAALDEGDILLQKGGIKIEDHLTYDDLYNEQCDVIQQTVNDFFNHPIHYLQNATTQIESEATYAPRLPFETGYDESVASIKEKYKSWLIENEHK